MVLPISCIWAPVSPGKLFDFFGRFMCLNHEFTHTQIFKVKWVGNVLTMFVLGHSHGLPFGSYYINHVIMHHKGSNAWGVDFSSTEKYNR